MGDVAKTGPAPMLELEDYIPSGDAEYLLLEEALIRAGCPKTRAALILATLVRLRSTGSDGLITVTRSQYRRELLKLGAPPWKGGRSSEYMGALISSLDLRRSREKHKEGRAGRGRDGRRPPRATIEMGLAA